MKVTEKIQLIDHISSELQQRYTYPDLELFLDEFQVADLEDGYRGFNSKRLYAKTRLRGVNPSKLVKMAAELEIDPNMGILPPPKNWEDTTAVKAFITHLASHKDVAVRLRSALLPYNIEGFVAHEDIKASAEWEEELLRALSTMDLFISIHTKGLSASVWCQQEIGFARARNVKIIPVRFDELPQGFIGRIQALHRRTKTAEAVAKEIVEILRTDDKTSELYASKIQSYAEPEDDDDGIPF